MAEENKDNQENKKEEGSINDLLKKILYQGVGMAAGAKERVEKAVKELIGEKKISNEEGKKIVDDLSSNIDSKAKDLESKIRGVINEALLKVRPATKSEVEELKKRIEDLEKRVASLD
jgi:polyhydroxyalkanoate synthesis regulator phasin